MHEAGHDRDEVVLDISLQYAQRLEPARGILGDLLELHNQVFDHAELNTGVAQKTIRILTDAEHGRPAGFVEWAADAAAPVLALDTPSGLDVTSGERHTPSVRADATVTLALPKVGLIGSAAVGDLYLADLTIGDEVYGPMGLAVPRDLFAPGPVVHLT